MGTQARRQREIQEREALFLGTAAELIHSEGLLNLQMARIAERSQYAVGTLYQHFSSKEDLLLALVTRGAGDRLAMFERVTHWPARSRDRMFALSVADMLFVKRNPDFFRLVQYSMCQVAWNAASAPRRQQVLEAAQPIQTLFDEIVAQAVAEGDLDLRGTSSLKLTSGFWALNLGFHYLVHAEGVLDEVVSACHPYELMCQHYQHLLNGLGWKPLFDVSDHAALDALVRKICLEVFDEPICTP